jgi:uncharacterized coiled-coil protein SlyX
MSHEQESGNTGNRLHELERDTVALKSKVDAQHEKLELLIHRVRNLEESSKDKDKE